MSKPKDVRLIRTEIAERFAYPWITAWRVERYAAGIGYFTVAGFPTIEEAKEYRRKLLRSMRGNGDGCPR